MKNVLIVGGANGIGLSMATILAKREETEKVYIVDKAELAEEFQNEKIESVQFDLTGSDYSLFDGFADIDGLIITAGFGRLALFKDIPEEMISTYFNVNTIPVIRIIKHFYEKLLGKEDFFCGVMVSIAGFMSSPFFSLYGATKAALKIFIESVNVELEKSGSTNRILNVSPGSIKGTSFNGGATDLSETEMLAKEIIQHIESKDDLFIPKYDEVFHEVLERYHADFRKEGLHSYDYKLLSGRLKK
jgi:short-subunit dehydrogenase